MFHSSHRELFPRPRVYEGLKNFCHTRSSIYIHSDSFIADAFACIFFFYRYFCGQQRAAALIVKLSEMIFYFSIISRRSEAKEFNGSSKIIVVCALKLNAASRLSCIFKARTSRGFDRKLAISWVIREPIINLALKLARADR